MRALQADATRADLQAWRTAVWGLAWGATALFAATFFLSAATINSALREAEDEDLVDTWSSPFVRALSQSRLGERIASRLSPQSHKRLQGEMGRRAGADGVGGGSLPTAS